MDGKANNSPMLKAAGLWAKSSVKGGQYLTERLGGVKVLILENRERKSEDDPSQLNRVQFESHGPARPGPETVSAIPCP
jgi:hypothetical protein